MANRIVQAIYDLKDNISGKLVAIGNAFAGNKKESDSASQAIERNNKRVADSFKGSTDVISSLKDSLGELTVIAGTIGAALGAIKLGKDAIIGASQVETSLVRVSALASGAKEEFDKLEQKVTEAARAVNVSSQISAGAAAALAEQGQSTSEIFESLIPTLQLSKIGVLDVAEAAGIVDDALDVFGESAGNAQHVVDALTVASKGSKEGLAGLSKALSAVGPLAIELGLSFDRTVSILGVFAQNGISAEKAAKGLRTIFADLQEPTSILRESLAKLGDNSSDFGTALRTLATSGDRGLIAIRGLDTAQQSLISFLVQQGLPKINDFAKSIAGAGGAAETTAKKLDDNLTGAFKRAENSFGILSEELVKPILSPLKDELLVLSKAFDDFSKTDAFRNLQAGLKAFVEAGIASITEFGNSIDFASAGQKIAEFGETSKKFFSEFKENVGIISSAVTLFVNSTVLAFNTLKTATLGISTAVLKPISLVQSGIASYIETVAKIPGTGETIKGLAKDFRASAEQISLQADGFAEATVESAKKTAASFEKLTSDITGSGDAAENSSAKILKLGDKVGGISPQVASAIGSLATFAEGLRLISPDTAKAAQDLEGLGASTNYVSQKFVELKEAIPKKSDYDSNNEGQDKTKRGYEGISSSIQQVTKSQDDSKASLDEVSKASAAASAALPSFGQALSDTLQLARKEFSDLGDGAGRAYDRILKGILDTQVAFGTQRAGAQFLQAINDAADKTRVFLGDLRKQLDGEIGSINNFGNELESALARGANASRFTVAGIEATIAAVERGDTQFKELGDQDLARLRGALESAKQKVQEITDKANSAKESLTGIGDQLADELDQINGNQKSIEDRRFKEQLAQISELAKQAGASGAAEAAAAIARANQLHALKLKQIEEEEKARNASGSASNSNQASQIPSTNRQNAGGSNGEVIGNPQVTNNNITINGLVGDGGEVLRTIKKGLSALTNLSGN